jgi:hypothetical protein
MNHKIANAIKRDAASDEKQIIHSALNTKIKKYNTGNGKNDKENVVSLKGMFVFWLVVISVKIPHESVHNVFVGEPGHTFHEQKNT